MLLCCQYFGNLVTCLDWDEAWLNEAFALFYQYKSVDVAQPTMRYVSFTQLSIVTYILIVYRVAQLK